MQQGYTIGEASHYLQVDPKTARRWCRILGIEPDIVSSGGRIKLYSQEQLDHIAVILQRSADAKPPQHKRESISAKEEQSISPLLVLQERLESLEQAMQATRETFEQVLIASKI